MGRVLAITLYEDEDGEVVRDRDDILEVPQNAGLWFSNRECTKEFCLELLNKVIKEYERGDKSDYDLGRALQVIGYMMENTMGLIVSYD